MCENALANWNCGTYCYGKPADETIDLSTTRVATISGHTLYSWRGCVVNRMEPAARTYHTIHYLEENVPLVAVAVMTKVQTKEDSSIAMEAKDSPYSENLCQMFM